MENRFVEYLVLLVGFFTLYRYSERDNGERVQPLYANAYEGLSYP